MRPHFDCPSHEMFLMVGEGAPVSVAPICMMADREALAVCLRWSWLVCEGDLASWEKIEARLIAPARCLCHEGG